MTPLEKIAIKHFGVTDELAETGYILSDGTKLDLSGRHEAGWYVRRGDRFVPKRGQPDDLANRRVVDHRQLPEEIRDALGKTDSEAMLAFMDATGVLRVMPGVGFSVTRMPTVEALASFMDGWKRAYQSDSVIVDILNMEGYTEDTEEISDPDLEKLVEFLEPRFESRMSGATSGPSKNIVTNVDDAPSQYRHEVLQAQEPARRAGARGPLEFVGMGAYGIVFCDQADHAWKVFRRTEGASGEELLFLRDVLEDEYEWLRDAAISKISKNVARVYAMHLEEVVLERECVRGVPGSWAQSGELTRLHREIEKAMTPLGWTAPEYKESSYIIESGTGIPRLVDISMAQRIGMNLAKFVDDVLDGRRRTHNTWHDLAFFILREGPYEMIPRNVANRLLSRLVELDPKIGRSFVLPEGA